MAETVYGVRIVSTDSLNGTICKQGDKTWGNTDKVAAENLARFKNSHEGGFYTFEVFEYGEN